LGGLVYNYETDKIRGTNPSNPDDQGSDGLWH
jgi:hypothetical protein